MMSDLQQSHKHYAAANHLKNVHVWYLGMVLTYCGSVTGCFGVVLMSDSLGLTGRFGVVLMSDSLGLTGCFGGGADE